MNPWDGVPVIDISGRREMVVFTSYGVQPLIDLHPGVRRVVAFEPERLDLYFRRVGDDTQVLAYDGNAELVTDQTVRNYGTDLHELIVRPTFRMHLLRFIDLEFDVVYLYDIAEEGFGYALNLSDPQLSEWGYASFAEIAK